MSYITSSLIVIITFILIKSTTSYSQEYMYYPTKNYTRVLELKQGLIQGVVVSPNYGSRLLMRVEHYRGIPYAAPPVGELRFMPPSGAPSWEGIKYADTFGPVCPQMFPDTENMTPQRLKEFLRLKNYLTYQLEDCLYLNVYVPHNPDRDEEVKYPVIIFIHGESYEWNSGNPYDGSVLAAYAKVVVVTFNFRLGILGFLKIDSADGFNSNFGLVDQIAALVWVRDNIEAFGGDPSKVTLLGHGTGAACANLLMQSPMIKPGNKTLCHRAIMMGGTAIADWALASDPRNVTDQVARALGCKVGDKACLRGKRLDEIMGAHHVVTKPYSTRFGPIVDSSVIPNDPLKSMKNLSRFQLMFGVTEWESLNVLSRDAITKGMHQEERDQELINYLGYTCDQIPELCRIYTGSYYENREAVRDTLLDILSDARTVAPMVKMGMLHSSNTFHSYFYVFSHKTKSKEYLRGKTTSGEELPYVFGVPLDGSSFHFVDNYTEDEILFSKVIMTYIRNFAYGGNPNSFVEMEEPEYDDDYGVIKRMQYWPAFNKEFQRYSLLDIPIATFSHYRLKKMQFWNVILPKTFDYLASQYRTTHSTTTEPPPKRPKGTPPFIIRYPFNQEETSSESSLTDESTERKKIFGNVIDEGTERPDSLNKIVYGTVINSEQNPSELQKANTMNVVVICGCVFLLINFMVFLLIYYKCYMAKKNRVTEITTDEVDGDVENAEKKNLFGEGQHFVANGGGLLKMISKSSKSDDVYEAVKLGSQNSKKHRLVRQLSSSTIDAHTKVRDWIANGITGKTSPKPSVKPKLDIKIVGNSSAKNQFPKQDLNSENSTLGRSPTRPVSPVLLQSESIEKTKRGIIKQHSHNSSQDSKRRDKVSVAIDATPSGRGPSVLAQQPIELSKSLDFGASCSKAPIRRSATLEDFSAKAKDEIEDLTKSVNSLISKPTIIKISHSHSKSDPVEDIYVSSKSKRLKTFDPAADVNVTSCEEQKSTRPLSPEESLMTIKRRNFPKVLPDYPTKESLAQKRRSMPVPNLSIPVNSLRNRVKLPPAPPVRTTSTLGRKPQNQAVAELVCNSAPVLLEETSSSPEPEITYNNLYVGPLIPKKQEGNSNLLDTNPIYSSLSALKKPETSTEKVSPVAIVTTDPKNPIKKLEPKTVIRPKMVRQISDPKSRPIPRVTATDNLPGHHYIPTKTGNDDSKLSKVRESESDRRPHKPTQIPTPVKKHNDGEKSHSSSETSPSEESDTGTVVAKKIE